MEVHGCFVYGILRKNSIDMRTEYWKKIIVMMLIMMDSCCWEL